MKNKKKMYIALHILPSFCLFWVSEQFSSLIMAISIGHYAFTIITNTYFHILYTKTCDKSWFSCVWRPQIHSSYKLRPQIIRRNFNLNTIRNCWGHPSLHISIIFFAIDPQSVMLEGLHNSVFCLLVAAMLITSRLSSWADTHFRHKRTYAIAPHMCALPGLSEKQEGGVPGMPLMLFSTV